MDNTKTNYKNILTPEQYKITREGGTESPHTGEYCNIFSNGTYLCICCNAPLFSSEAKYDSGKESDSEDSVAMEVNILYFNTPWIKPFFFILSAWFLTQGIQGRKSYLSILFLSFFILASLILIQPDFGMTFLFFAVFFAQLFVAGLSIILVIVLVLILFLLTITSYNMIPNVRTRFNMYIDPSSHDTYQLDQSLKAFKSGGIFGKGLGQGTLKENIPDAHTDFIFSIAGEELGFIFCSLLILFFIIIIIRSLLSILKKRELYSLIVVVGLVSIFGLQALINISSSIGASPTKGMTLPLISYGGSSMLSSSLLIGILLSHLRYLKNK